MNNGNERNERVGENVENATYRYTYRAPTPKQKREAESILREYEPQAKELSDFEKLQRLQGRIDGVLTAVGLSLGIVGCLIFGGGMSLVLLNQEQVPLVVVGVALGVVGAAVMAAAYPIYMLVKRSLKKRYGDEIVRLCKNVMGTEEEK